MNPIFKPSPLTWEDIKGGVGENLEAEIGEFICEYCYPEEPRTWGSDDDLENDLVFFSETWERVGGYGWGNISTPEQTVAVLSLIAGAFYSSMSRDDIVEALVKSATKPRLVEIVTHVASAYCQYVSVKARVAMAESAEKAEETK